MAGDGVPAATDRLRDLQVQLGRNEGGEGHAEGAGRLGLQLLDADGRTVGDRLGGAAVGGDRGGAGPLDGRPAQLLQQRWPLGLQDLKQLARPKVGMGVGCLHGRVHGLALQLGGACLHGLVQRLQGSAHGRPQQGGIRGGVVSQAVDGLLQAPASLLELVGGQRGGVALQVQGQPQRAEQALPGAAGGVADGGGPIAAQEPLQVRSEAPQGRRVADIGSGR